PKFCPRRKDAATLRQIMEAPPSWNHTGIKPQAKEAAMPKRSAGFTHRFRRILVPTDFSTHSNEALDLALATLAKGGRILLVHLVQPMYAPLVADPSSAVLVY